MLLFTPEIDMPSVYIKKILLTNCFFFWISEVHRHFDREGVFGASRGAEGYIQLSGLVRHCGNHCLYCLYVVIKSPNALADQNVAISCHHMAPGDSNLFVILILRSLLSFLLLSGSCTERRTFFFLMIENFWGSIYHVVKLYKERLFIDTGLCVQLTAPRATRESDVATHTQGHLGYHAHRIVIKKVLASKYS